MLGSVLYETGELDQAETTLAEGSEAATAARRPGVGARIRIQLTDVRVQLSGVTEEALAECQAATAILTIPADAAIARAEQLLQTANGEPWAEADILMPLSVIYAYAGRFADARTAIARARSVYAGSAAKVRRAVNASLAGDIERIAGDPAAAEHHLREAYGAFRAMGERQNLSTVAGLLAEALYAQARLDEAQQMTEEAQAAASLADIDAQARASRGQPARGASHLSRPARHPSRASGCGRSRQPHRPPQRRAGLAPR